MKESKKDIIRILILGGLFVAAMALVSFLVWPYISLLEDPVAVAQFEAYVKSFGVFGVLIVFLMQVLQIIIAFLPGEAIELLAGILYGGVGGFAICLLGCVAASSLVFWLTRRFGVRLVNRFFSKKKLENFHFLQESNKLDVTVFLLFLLPGTPKDLLTYVVGLSRMHMLRFLVLSTLARVPSIASSTFLGSAVIQGEWVQAAVLFGLTAAIGLVGILGREKILHWAKQMSKRRKK